MKKTLGILSLLALISFAFTFSLNKSSESNIQFSNKNFNEVLADAANTEKLVFIDVSTSWCGYCKKMKANTNKLKQLNLSYAKSCCWTFWRS